MNKAYSIEHVKDCLYTPPLNPVVYYYYDKSINHIYNIWPRPNITDNRDNVAFK